MPSISELLVERNTALTKAQQIAAKYKADKDGVEPVWTAEDLASIGSVRSEVDRINDDITKLKPSASASAVEWIKNTKPTDIETAPRKPRTGDGKQVSGRQDVDGERPKNRVWTPEAIAGFRRPGRQDGRTINLNPRNSGYRDRIDHLRSAEYSQNFNRYLITGQTKALMRADDEASGGFFVTPEEMSSEIIKTLDDEVYIQGLSRVHVIPNARSLGMRKRTAKAGLFGRGREIGDITEAMENSLRYGKRILTPKWQWGAARISKELVRLAPNTQSAYLDEIMIDWREFCEDDYMYGPGIDGPLGLFIPSSEGISTARDITVETADLAGLGGSPTVQTNFGYRTILRGLQSLKNRYQSAAIWMFHRLRMVDLAMMTDPEGHIIFQMSAREGIPDRLLGRPILQSEWMPNSLAADTYFGGLFDLRYYHICFGMQMEMQTLFEIAARQNQIEFHFRYQYDGMAMLEEAFTRLKTAAA